MNSYLLGTVIGVGLMLLWIYFNSIRPSKSSLYVGQKWVLDPLGEITIIHIGLGLVRFEIKFWDDETSQTMLLATKQFQRVLRKHKFLIEGTVR